MAITSQALQRVLAHKRPVSPGSKKSEPTMEGIYLSKLQLKTLGEKLLNASNGPDGVCFMVGVEKIGAKSIKTVEVVPYRDEKGNRIIFNNCIFTLNAEGLEENSNRDLIFDGNGHRTIPNGNPPAAAMKMAVEAPITVGSQRTPPPFS